MMSFPNAKFLHAEAEMHVMDRDSKIVEQDATLSLPANPDFVSLYFITETGDQYILAMPFSNWQEMTRKLYTRVKASIMIAVQEKQ